MRKILILLFLSGFFSTKPAAALTARESLSIYLLQHPFETQLIKDSIKILAPNTSEARRQKLAVAIHWSSQQYQIHPQVILAIIGVESDFRQITNSHGDISLIQINFDIWDREFKRLGRKPLNKARLKRFPSYGIMRGTEILRIYKDRAHPLDPYWFTLYHSTTEKLRTRYLTKVKSKLSQIEHLWLLSPKNLFISKNNLPTPPKTVIMK